MAYQNILLIDDDEDDQEIFLIALQQASPSVSFYAESKAGEALQKLVNGYLIPDAIFLDLNMPIMNGQQFLVEIKNNSKLKDIPVIIFSTSSNAATISLMKELGAIEYITKPPTLDELITTLSKHVN